MMRRRRFLAMASAFFFAQGAETAQATDSRAAGADNATAPKKLLVLDFDLLDTSNEPVDQRADHARRLAGVRDQIATGLAARGVYDVVGRATIASELDAILRQTYIRTCNGCDIDLAKRAGADLVLLGQVNKVSTLIMSMGVSIKRVSTGELIYHQGFDFRGDNDTSWSRAAKFFVDRIAREPIR